MGGLHFHSVKHYDDYTILWIKPSNKYVCLDRKFYESITLYEKSKSKSEFIKVLANFLQITVKIFHLSYFDQKKTSDHMPLLIYGDLKHGLLKDKQNIHFKMRTSLR